nr:cytochrome c biogenesis protein CcdA [Brevibacillus daliensis]
MQITVWLAVAAGFLSFISPCCLPLYPSFVSYITGAAMSDVKLGKAIFKRQAFLHTLFFIIGFSIVFIALGLSTSWIGGFFAEYNDLIRQLGGLLLVVIGLVMAEILHVGFMKRSFKMDIKKRPLGYTGSILVGITYAAGWTPCVGPILAGIITLGMTDPSNALLYTLAYTVGFAAPFFVMTFFISKLKWINKYSEKMMKIGGWIMVLFGIMLYTDQLNEIAIYFNKVFGPPSL